jgi:hypothetical protein
LVVVAYTFPIGLNRFTVAWFFHFAMVPRTKKKRSASNRGSSRNTRQKGASITDTVRVDDVHDVQLMDTSNAVGVEADKEANLLENFIAGSHTDSAGDVKELEGGLDEEDGTGSESETNASGIVGSSERKCCTHD